MRLGDSAVVTFFWSEERARAFVGQGDAAASPHVIVTASGPLRVQVGSTYPLPGGEERLLVEAFYHDLILDPETHEAHNRSGKPLNPALRVALVDEAGQERGATWLFARYPTFHSSDTGSALAGLRYSHEPHDQGMESWVVVGETRRILRIGGEGAADLGETIQVGGSRYALTGPIGSASATPLHSSRSDRPLRPVVELAMSDGSRPPLVLPLGYAADLGSKRHLVLAMKEDKEKDYLSTVSIHEGGREIRRETIEVNSPLTHGGYTLYQADFHPDDLTYSGFQVVRDPLLPVVYAGFVACIVGILVAFYVAPALRRRRERSGT
jgi:hypothetical protein